MIVFSPLLVIVVTLSLDSDIGLTRHSTPPNSRASEFSKALVEFAMAKLTAEVPVQYATNTQFEPRELVAALHASGLGESGIALFCQCPAHQGQ
jgi:hypothetical protein